jgi:hypothetical protein
VFDWIIKKVPDIQKGQRMCDKCRKTITNLPRSFGNGAVVSSSSEYDINKKRKHHFPLFHEQDSGVIRRIITFY